MYRTCQSKCRVSVAYSLVRFESSLLSDLSPLRCKLLTSVWPDFFMVKTITCYLDRCSWYCPLDMLTFGGHPLTGPPASLFRLVLSVIWRKSKTMFKTSKAFKRIKTNQILGTQKLTIFPNVSSQLLLKALTIQILK